MNRKERRERKKELNILNDLITVLNQYFPELISKFNDLTDLRKQSYVKYEMKVIFIVKRLVNFTLLTFIGIKENVRANCSSCYN